VVTQANALAIKKNRGRAGRAKDPLGEWGIAALVRSQGATSSASTRKERANLQLRARGPERSVVRREEKTDISMEYPTIIMPEG